jgi:hypothetical protein
MRLWRSAVILVALLAPACGAPAAPSASTGTPTPQPVGLPSGVNAPLNQMLLDLTNYIARALTDNRNLIPANPQNIVPIQAKVAMLQVPTLRNDIITGRRWAEGLTSGANGRTIQVGLVFPVESMRPEAAPTVDVLVRAMPLLESFYGVAWPATNVRVWYGFVVGNSSGGGIIYSEDRGTYEGRTSATRLPFDSILGHELAHAYMGHEGLNQFVELYVFNTLQTGSSDPAAWTMTRGWAPGSATNTGVAALLDIYQLVGFETMQKCYRAIYPLRAAYGSPLAQSVKDAFLVPVPEALKAQVAEKLAAVTY